MASHVIRVVIIKDNLDINGISDTPEVICLGWKHIGISCGHVYMLTLKTSRDILIN